MEWKKSIVKNYHSNKILLNNKTRHTNWSKVGLYVDGFFLSSFPLSKDYVCLVLKKNDDNNEKGKK